MRTAQYPIAELARISGVSPKEIRNCVRTGAIPGPVGRAGGARYGEEHLKALVAHRASCAKDQASRPGLRYFPLSEFARMTGLSTHDIKYLVRSGAVPPPVGRGSVAKYSDDHLWALKEHLGKKAVRAIRRFVPVVAAVEGTALPQAEYLLFEMAPDIKVLLYPDLRGRNREQLLRLMSMVAAFCRPVPDAIEGRDQAQAEDVEQTAVAAAASVPRS